MMKSFNCFLLVSSIIVSGLMTASNSSQGLMQRDESEYCTHTMQLQLFDGEQFPVDGTQFWITLKIEKVGKKIIISLPAINFQTGPISTEDPNIPLPGGTLRTVNGFLPECLRPSDPVYRSYLVPSNNGISSAFSFATPLVDQPTPPAGYILSVTFFGGLVIQAAGTFQNLIAPGPQVMMPTDITYFQESPQKLCKNVVISSGASDITEFTFKPDENDGYRDSHVNDAFDNVLAWAWSDNSNIAKDLNTLNLMVAVGEVSHGKLKVASPVQLTNLAPGDIVWDTAIAINRTNPNNIVVSWGLIGSTGNFTYRAVSFDGGKTWPENGPTNIQPTGPIVGTGFGDNPGVAADKFGNIWYVTTNLFDGLSNFINQPTFWISSDGGVTFSVAYTAPLPINVGVDSYDFVQFCFGGDGLGNYGLWFVADYYIVTTDIIPVVAFLPITGLGSFGPAPANVTFLNALSNTQYFPSLTASLDGRVWCESYVNAPSLYQASAVRFKSPGAVNVNYAGPWQLTISNDSQAFDTPTHLIADFTSYPVRGYFNSVRTIIYDETRQALYALFAQQAPDLSQNMRLFLLISRDNGQTWTEPLYISSTTFANRGFPSMTLDTTTGNLVFGWYDGRNDPTQKSVEYMGAVLPAKTLDELTQCIPASNPLYVIVA